MTSIVVTNLGTVSAIVAAMAVVAVIEAAVPLHARERWSRAHLRPNLALTALTFATNFFFNAALLVALADLQASGGGLLPRLVLPPAVAAAVAVVVLDFSFWAAHVAMHAVPALWRFHRVHHADPAVDVTTTIRQHPGEGVIRYAFTAAFACAIGASPAAFAVYRTWSAVNGLLEHANVRVPPWLDRALSLVTTWPGIHKVHHSRTPSETNTNYGNIFSAFDRLFGTFTPATRGATVACGLDGFDDPATQTTLGLLALPFRRDAYSTATRTTPDGSRRGSARHCRSASGSPTEISSHSSG